MKKRHTFTIFDIVLFFFFRTEKAARRSDHASAPNTDLERLVLWNSRACGEPSHDTHLLITRTGGTLLELVSLGGGGARKRALNTFLELTHQQFWILRIYFSRSPFGDVTVSLRPGTLEKSRICSHGRGKNGGNFMLRQLCGGFFWSTLFTRTSNSVIMQIRIKNSAESFGDTPETLFIVKSCSAQTFSTWKDKVDHIFLNMWKVLPMLRTPMARG